MKTIDEIKSHTIQLVDDLKATFAAYGLGGDGNEYKIITYMFLYKFLNDKFGTDLKTVPNPQYSTCVCEASSWESGARKLKKSEYDDALSLLPSGTPRLKPEH